jgi:hypothetical protein
MTRRSRGISLGALVLVLTVVPGAWAQTPASAPAKETSNLVTETVFVPQVYYVGDLVEARLTLLLPEGKALLPPLSLPTQNWVLIRDVQVRHDPPFERVTIKFVPFAPGVKPLPTLVLGDISLDGVLVSTNSLLAKDDPADLSPPRDQLLLPHTEIFVFLAFLVIIVLPLAVWRSSKPVAALVHLLWKRSDRHRAWRQLTKDLRRLQTRALALKGPEFYTQFSILVRTYLGSRFDRDFRTLTAAEVRVLLQPLPPAWTAEWVRLVHRADVVRFDAQDPPEKEKLEDLEALRREVGHLEGKEAPHVNL